MVSRVMRSWILSLLAWRLKISLLPLKPTSDKKVEAEDSAAAMIPAISKTPGKVGIRFIAAQISAPSGGSMFGLLRLMAAPTNSMATYNTITAAAAPQPDRTTTCSFFAIR
jgi:hypothetical protein